MQGGRERRALAGDSVVEDAEVERSRYFRAHAAIVAAAPHLAAVDLEHFEHGVVPQTVLRFSSIEQLVLAGEHVVRCSMRLYR